MHAEKPQTRSVEILTAVHRPDDGPPGIGVMVTDAPATPISRIYEQASGSDEYLYLLAVLRALQLGKRLRAREISILCPGEEAVKIVNREAQLPVGSPLFPLYMKIRALIYTFRLAEVRAVPASRIEPALELAVTASKMPSHDTDMELTLFPTGDLR